MTNSIEIIFPQIVEKYVNLQCNGKKSLYTNPPEIAYTSRYLEKLKPKVILDIGCGIGRVSTYLFKRYNWTDSLFVLADGNSGNEQFAGLRRDKVAFYNSLKATKDFCKANGMRNFVLLNLEECGWHKLMQRPDLVYSFLAFGFHWPIGYCLNDIYPYLKRDCLLLFGMRTDLIDDYKEWNNEQMKNIDKSKYKIIDFIFDSAMGSLVLESL